ncbi:beta-glucuronidase [Diachasmimorpha longicaudata]|uniref:beta-glucuronidase n=1 Tax=Diachasmimorpha longicaudata TaxID=58733 RepID=UPI0030B8EF3F
MLRALKLFILLVLVSGHKDYSDDDESIERLEFDDEEPVPPLSGMLYPRESESREVKSLDGLWDFAISPSDDYLSEVHHEWYQDDLSKSAPVMQMPVPSSYNDITTSKALRDHIGGVWYERKFFVPLSWEDQRVFIRFGSVNYLAQVWINGRLVTNHEMGHLPFEAEINSYIFFGAKNRITVAVDNILLQTTVPQGNINKMEADNGTTWVQSYSFDFFNYAGIHRPVLLSTRPRVYISDITVETSIFGETGIVKYSVEAAGYLPTETPNCRVTVREEDGTLVTSSEIFDFSGTLKISNVKLWWARGMGETPGYLYTFEVTLTLPNSAVQDVYRLPIGIRTIKWNSTSLLLNDRPVYLRGFGRHEDSIIRGRGLDLVTMTRDHELLKWVGANAYRTSHYPYSDEVMDMADRQGFLIIDECPAVDTENFSSGLLKRHKISISELIRRDKNRPSVVMWSISNEPRTTQPGADGYFKQVAQHTKNLDRTRPITIALSTSYIQDQAGQFLDVISFNRYNSWYSNAGRLDMIIDRVIAEAQNWHEKYNKPVLMSEYGADTVSGLHELPEYIWSEEYQTAVLSKHFEAFDRLREKGWFIGEFIWNFADFRTAQSYTRVAGNKKGIFTRNREPKMAAHLVRRRYHALGQRLDSEEPPEDLEYYSASFERHEEL